MVLVIQRRGISITANTPEEAAAVVKALEDADGDLMNIGQTYRAAATVEGDHMWDPATVRAYLSKLGPPQIAVIKSLTSGPKSDKELRGTLAVGSNQALAGILSGISKQAVALGIPARQVFQVENFRHAGKRSSRYTLTDSFKETLGNY